MTQRHGSDATPGSFARWSVALLGFVGIAVTWGVASLPAASVSVPSTPSFAAAKNYITGRGPRWVTVGDLNGDAKPDIVTANVNPSVIGGTASLLLGRGDGSFEPKRDLPIGDLLAVGDLNGDGRPDLASVSSDAPITASVFLNDGKGSFGPEHDYPGTTNSEVVGDMALGDFNGDGHSDLAVADPLAGRVAIFLNSGDGSFFEKGAYKTGDPAGTVATGDLNADGRSDLVTTGGGQGGNTITVVLNRGDASFLKPRDYAIRPQEQPVEVAVGDLNGDRRADLAVVDDGFEASVFLNKGDGRFRAHRDYRASPGSDSVAIGDLNGDGKPDLATADFQGYASVLQNRGNGSFQPGLVYRVRGTIPVAIAIGDLNGDARRDLVSANRDSNTVSVLLNTPAFCNVQDVQGQTLAVATRTIVRGHCRVGTVRRAYSRSRFFPKGRVISESPKPYTVLKAGGRVNVVVSRGRRG